MKDYMEFNKNGLKAKLTKTKQGGAVFVLKFAGMSEYVSIPKGSYDDYADAFELAALSLKVWAKTKKE